MALAKRFHPDLNASRTAAARMQRVNDAYAVLGSEQARRGYDSERARAAVEHSARPPDASAATGAPRGAAGDVDGEPATTASTPAEGLTASRDKRRGHRARRTWRIGAVAAAGATAIIIAFILRGAGAAGSRRTAPTPTAAEGVVRQVLSLGAVTSGQPLHAIDVVTGAAALPAFHGLDALSDASYERTSAGHAWTFSALGCSVFAGEYDKPDSARAAIVYWRGQAAVNEQDSGSVVVAVFGCTDSAGQDAVMAGIHGLLGRGAAAATPASR